MTSDDLETGTTSFLDRIDLTKRLDENLVPFMDDHAIDLIDYGHPVILAGNGSMRHWILRRQFKKSKPVLMIKFSPDFIVVDRQHRLEPFFMETKASITPVFFAAQIRRIRDASGFPDLQREDILAIEREAWDVYNRYYPKRRLAICVASPYHPRLLLADWVSRLQPLFRLDLDHNVEAGGSGTPHVNIHMGKMRTLPEFLSDELGVQVDMEAYTILPEFIKKWDLNKPAGRVNWTQFNNVVLDLQYCCPWLKTRNEPKNWNRPQQRRLI